MSVRCEWEGERSERSVYTVSHIVGEVSLVVDDAGVLQATGLCFGSARVYTHAHRLISTHTHTHTHTHTQREREIARERGDANPGALTDAVIDGLHDHRLRNNWPELDGAGVRSTAVRSVGGHRQLVRIEQCGSRACRQVACYRMTSS